jgi:hypothetical protein
VSVADPPALQWGMTANVVLAARGAQSASLLPSTSVYQTVDGKPRYGLDPAASKGTLRRDDCPSIARTDREAPGLAAGEWIVATGAEQAARGSARAPLRSGRAPGTVDGQQQLTHEARR